MIPFMNEQGQIVALIVQEHYEDDNLEHNHHFNEANEEEQEEKRNLDKIEITGNPISETQTETNLQCKIKISENTNYQIATKEIAVHLPSQVITSQAQQSQISAEFSQQQQKTRIESTINRFRTPHKFQSFDNTQNLVPVQFTQDENFKRQNKSFKDVNFSGNPSIILSQQESIALTQNEGFQEDSLIHPSQQVKIVPVPSQTSDKNVIAKPHSTTKLRLFNGYSTLKEALKSGRERKNGNSQAEESEDDRDSHKNPTSVEVEVSKVDLDVALQQEGGRPDLNERNFELGADRFEDDSGKAQEFDYEFPRDNTGHLESDFREDVSSGGSTKVSLKNDLGVSSDTNLETGEADALHFANSLLASMMENLEEDEEEETSTYNDNVNFFRIPTIEDPVAMTEQSSATAGTPEIFQEVAGHAMHGGFHGGVYDRGE